MESESWPESEYVDFHWTSYITFIVAPVTFVIGLIGNSILIYILPKPKHCIGKGQKQWNFILANLAFLDLVFLFVSTFGTFYFVIYDEWNIGGFMCKIYMSLQQFRPLLSALILTGLTIDAVKKIGKSPCIALIPLSWTFAILLILPLLKNFEMMRNKLGNKICYIPGLELDDVLRAYMILLLIFPLFITGVLLVVLLTQKSHVCFTSSSKRIHVNQSGRRKLMLALVISHFICWIFYCFFCVAFYHSSYLMKFLREYNIWLILNALGICLLRINSALNPFLVMILRDDLQKYMNMMFHAKKLNPSSTVETQFVEELPLQVPNILRTRTEEGAN